LGLDWWLTWHAARTEKRWTLEGGQCHVETRPVAVAEEIIDDMQKTAEMLVAWVPQITTPEAGVPRQFGVGILLVITAMYAVLFAVLRAMDAPPSVYTMVGLFVFAIGLGQMLLFKGQRPRRASMIARLGFVVSASILHWIFEGFETIDLVWLLNGAVYGVVCGYVAGVLIASVFLLIDKLRTVRGKSRGPGPSIECSQSVSSLRFSSH